MDNIKSYDLTISNLSTSFGNQTMFVNLNKKALASNGLLIKGHSGRGKTTLMKYLCGLSQPDSGEIRFGENEITNMKEAERTKFRRQYFGIAFQDPHLVPSLTAKQNIDLAFRIKNTPKNEIDAKTKELMERFEIDHRLKSYPSTLSGGEQRRVALARAFAGNPKIVILDEPLSGLDEDLSKRVILQIHDLKEETDAFLIIASHIGNFSKICKTSLNLNLHSVSESEIDRSTKSKS